jgi:hypothetical protein
VTAFMMVCYIGIQMGGGIYFKNVNDCMHFRNKLHNQVIVKGEKEELYQCMCKLVPSVDTNKVKVY